MSHWYAQDGSPRHFITKPDGTSRDATLREARKYGWVPGFSGVVSILSNPGLDKWKENQILDAAWESPILPSGNKEENFRAYCTEVKKLANERVEKAKEQGLKIHDAIEQYIKANGNQPAHHVVSEDTWDYVEAVSNAVCDEFGIELTELQAESTFAATEGYGGMVDAYMSTFSGEQLLLDWKTKDRPFDDKQKLAYDTHGMQLAAYRHGIGLDLAVCANVFIGPDKKIRIHVWDEEDLKRLFEKFLLTLKLWQIDRNYDSSFTIK